VLYDYECQNEECDKVMEDVKQSIHDKPKKKCPKCGKMSLQRIIYGGIGMKVAQDPTTIGQAIDKNTRENATLIQEREHKKRENAPKKEKLFHQQFGGDATVTDINKMSPAQQKRYIMQGKK